MSHTAHTVWAAIVGFIDWREARNSIALSLASLLVITIALLALFTIVPYVSGVFMAFEAAGRSGARIVVEIREPDLPVKCVRAQVLDRILLGMGSRPLVDGQDGKTYRVHEFIPRTEGMRYYPCRDRSFEAAYAEEVTPPAAPAGKNQGG